MAVTFRRALSRGKPFCTMMSGTPYGKWGTMIQVALVDDHPLILKILRQELSRAMDIKVIWDMDNVSKLMSRIAKEPPHVLVLDLGFASQNFEPTAAVRDLRVRFPQVSILILTAYDDPVWIEELLRAGAQGYVVKSDDLSLRLAEAIRAVSQGRTFLSPTAAMALSQASKRHTLTDRERTILRLAAEGRSNQEIARTLGISDGTVRNHLSNLYAKLNVDTREAAIRVAQQMRELPRPGAKPRHELRTPLNTLLGLARILEMKLVRDNQIGPGDADLLRMIVSEAERLDGLLEDYGD